MSRPVTDAEVRTAERLLKQHGWGAKSQSEIRLIARRQGQDPNRMIVLSSKLWPLMNRLRKCARGEGREAVIVGRDEAELLLGMIAQQVPNPQRGPE